MNFTDMIPILPSDPKGDHVVDVLSIGDAEVFAILIVGFGFAERSKELLPQTINIRPLTRHATRLVSADDPPRDALIIIERSVVGEEVAVMVNVGEIRGLGALKPFGCSLPVDAPWCAVYIAGWK